MQQIPAPGSFLRRFAGDTLAVALRVPDGLSGRAFVRTNVGGAATARRERLAAAAEDRPPLATDWTDLPMVPSGPGLHTASLPLTEPGLFAAKAFFLPDGATEPLWPEGGDVRLKVAPASSRSRNSIYTAFTRCFKPGSFRSLGRHLDEIIGDMGFGIVQLLPIHPAPTVYGRMGRYGSPFAGLDFLAVDPAYAEFDPKATPLDQFRELLDGVHARGARLFLDLPANHTGWASTLLAHHPEWFRRDPDGRYHSPGAWGVVWEDLVELDYSRPGLREFMASVFEYWCSEGVDGFRCDAGYMVPQDVWTYIVDRVRTRYPETVFLLEGLGGKISVTRSLLDTAGLDWAYSEIFQTEDRSAFERYLPGAQTLSDEAGPLVHFAETHDNARLAARSPAYSRLRVRLAALLSSEGAFGITCGVEWFATEKIDVHDATDLRWGAPENQVADLRLLNDLLASHPAFAAGARLRMVQCADGNSLAVLRTPPAEGVRKSEGPRVRGSESPRVRGSESPRVRGSESPRVRGSGSPSQNGNRSSLLILANLDASSPQPVNWPAAAFDHAEPVDLLTGASTRPEHGHGGLCRLTLAPGQVLALSPELRDPETPEFRDSGIPGFRDSGTQCAGPPRVIEARYPEDLRRVIPVPPGYSVLLRSPVPLRTGFPGAPVEESHPLADGSYALLLPPPPDAPGNVEHTLPLLPGRGRRTSSPADGGRPPRSAPRGGALRLLALSPSALPRNAFPGAELRHDAERVCLLTNGRGAMAHVRVAWPAIASRYDALLASNPDPAVPCNRWILLSRCRLWLRRTGYSSAVDASCLERFETDGESGRWLFRVPVGLGQTADLSVVLRLLQGQNAATLDFALASPAPAVELIVRPDVESRSFHDLTKAYAGPEHDWPAACSPRADGVDFLPHGRPGLRLTLSGGTYVHEPEWEYCVGLPHDAQRGQDASTDLFSPGYFRVPLVAAGAATLKCDQLPVASDQWPVASDQLPVASDQWPETTGHRSLVTGHSSLVTGHYPRTGRALLGPYVVARDDVSTVIAGYPWFLDWGRDTFIVLRGLIAAGLKEESIAIVRAFARFERGGTLPNMIRGNDDSNRDTSDAPLWFSVAVRDLCARYGRKRILSLDCGGRTLLDVLVSIAEGYRRGTPNGIAMDPDSALVFSPPHFTWMDTNFPAGTPREGYPVEIQALWISALRFLARVQPKAGWKALADRASASVRDLFWLPAQGYFSDCLHAGPGTPARNAVADDHLRPNQLFLTTLGVFDPAGPADRPRLVSALRACARLLVPGAIRTLDDAPVSYPLPIDRDGQRLNDPLRPYWGAYAGDEDTRRKPAYHNGTAWTWPYPSYAEALLLLYGRDALPDARAYLAASAGLFEHGAIGHLPEILDGDAPHAQRGCDAQAWGDSEFFRVLSLCS